MNIPSEMKQCPQWVNFMLLPNPKKGKPDKVPLNPHTLWGAKPNDPSTWTTFDTAAAQVGKTGQCKRIDKDGNKITVTAPVAGVGFMFHANGIVGIDFDHCIENGQLAPWVAEWVDRFGSYTEISPSGTGIHILCKGSLHGRKAIKKPEVEIYDQGRYFTVTGQPYQTVRPLRDAQAALDELYIQYQDNPKPAPLSSPRAPAFGDAQILEKALKNSKFAALFDGDIAGYGSQSEADIALCNLLAFWTGRDTAQMDRLFRHSGLMREKWDRQQSGSTYGALTIDKAARECKNVYNPNFGKETGSQQVTFKKGAKLPLAEFHPENNPRYGWHDIGNGNLFADIFIKYARCVYETGRWYVFDGKRWKKDPKNYAVMKLCKKLSDELYRYAGTLPEGSRSKEYIEFALKWRSRNKRETIIKDATDVHPIDLEEFDRDLYLFNCKNGTLNLKTGEFYKHSPGDLLTMLSGVKYNPSARCERWEQYINEIMGDDREKAEYLQKAFGYALTGDTWLECFFMLYGATTRNGKGTLMETIKRMLGDYAAAANPETIAKKANPDSRAPSEDIAGLAGKRLVNVSEPDNGLLLSTALVKTLTGNDTIRARFLGENSFEYLPQFKLFINTNHLPRVTDPTLFTSGRVKVIPFERHFEEYEQDKHLKACFRKPENLSGIFNWCLAGLRKLYDEGLEMPASIAAATADYQKASDKMGQFFEEKMISDPLGEVRIEAVYPVYHQWCLENGFRPESKGAGFKSAVERFAEVVIKRPTGAPRNASAVSMILGFNLKFETDRFGKY